MKLIAATFAFALLLTGAALAGGDNGPSKTELTLFGKDPGDARALACYTRSYDATHLSAHPKQNVTNMSLLIDSTWSYDNDPASRNYQATLQVKFRTLKKPFETYGSCFDNMTDAATTDPNGLLHCGVDCDGGSINVRVKDANNILVDIPDGVRIYDPSQPADAEPDAGVPPKAEFGADDKTFMLAKSSLKNCFDLLNDTDKEFILDFTK